MAQAPELPREVEESVARQIGQRMTGGPRGTWSAPGGASLGESFRIYLLTADALSEHAGSLMERVKRTGLWHHQVYVARGGPLFARSMSTDGDMNLEVRELVQSGLANEISRSIEWIDANVHDDFEVSLLIAPAFYLTALLLVSSETERVLVVDVPRRLTSLKRSELYSGAWFLETLAGTEPVQGVPRRG